MLLSKDPGQVAISKDDMIERFKLFWQGEWTTLIRQSQSQLLSRIVNRNNQDDSQRGQQIQRAIAQVHQGELSAARQTLTSAGLAPGTNETLRDL